MMKFPEEVKVGWVKLKVSFDDSLPVKREILVRSHIDTQYIEIAGTIADDVKRELLWLNIHNVIGKILQDDISQEQERALGSGIMSILRHNQALLTIETIDEIDTLDIFGWQWKITRKPEHFELNGRTINTENEILLNDGLPTTQKIQTLWHEIYHIVYNLQGIYEYDNERDIDLRAFFLTGVIIENDLSWLTDQKELEEN